MLLALRQSAATRPVRAAPVASVPAPLIDRGYVVQPLRADQQSFVESPNAPRQGGRPATQTDFGSVTLVQDSRFPVVSRYLPVVPAVQRQAQPRPSRSYDDIYSGFVYPPAVEAPRGRSNTAGRTFEPATQTDFALKRPAYQPGRRWNGLMLGLPVRSVTFSVPANTTYEQALGFAQAWAATGAFPTQYFGLKAFYRGAVKDLCLVAVADAPAGMGGVPRVQKGGVTYAVYLVETSDPNASPVRMQTSAGVKAIREKT